MIDWRMQVQCLIVLISTVIFQKLQAILETNVLSAQMSINYLTQLVEPSMKGSKEL